MKGSDYLAERDGFQCTVEGGGAWGVMDWCVIDGLALVLGVIVVLVCL